MGSSRARKTTDKHPDPNPNPNLNPDPDPDPDPNPNPNTNLNPEPNLTRPLQRTDYFHERMGQRCQQVNEH